MEPGLAMRCARIARDQAVKSLGNCVTRGGWSEKVWVNASLECRKPQNGVAQNLKMDCMLITHRENTITNRFEC